MTKAPARYIGLCNLLSYVSLMCGVTAIVAAQEFKGWETAGLLIAIAALADTFDGKFARRFKRTDDEKAFGAQLDSLVDAVSFGLAPVVCVHSLVSMPSNSIRIVAFTASFIYVLCAVTRLGHYNIHHERQTEFIGLPTTLAALVWSTLFLLRPAAPLAIAAMILVGLAMISPLPIARPRGAAMWAYMAWFVLVLGLHGSGLIQGAL